MVRNRSSKALLGLTAFFVITACAPQAPEPGVERGAAVWGTCVPCHGSDGAGKRELGAPAIAGLPQWYLESQLNSFANNWRGAHPFDTVGIRMKSMVLALDDVDGDLESVAEFVAGLDPATPDDVFPEGDVSAGQATYVTCQACHGPQGMGNEGLRAPPIANQADWYLFEQLRKFKAGWRGAHPEDTWGGTMRQGSGVMTLDNQAMLNVVSYIETLQ